MAKVNRLVKDSIADLGNGADAATTQKVLTHHLSCLANGDLSGFMAKRKDRDPDLRREDLTEAVSHLIGFEVECGASKACRRSPFHIEEMK